MNDEGLEVLKTVDVFMTLSEEAILYVVNYGVGGVYQGGL